MKTTQFRIIVTVVALCLLLTSCKQPPVETQPLETQPTTVPETIPSGFYGQDTVYINAGGETLCYKILKNDDKDLTRDKRIDVFIIETHIEDIVWEVYATKEHPDLSYILLYSGTNLVKICQKQDSVH